MPTLLEYFNNDFKDLSLDTTITFANQTLNPFYVPWELVYPETFISRVFASAREREIKSKKSKQYIEFLISSK